MAKIRDVEAKYGYRLLIELDNGNVIYLNLADKVETVRFYDLKDVKLFDEVETDGYSIYWDYKRIVISLSEIFEITNIRHKEETENKQNAI